MDGVDRSDDIGYTHPWKTSSKPWRRRWMGVEPTMFLYMMAFMITHVVEDAFFIYKACRVNAGLSEDVCRNISHNPPKKVEDIVANFHIWENVASQGIPVILAFFIGSWSDRVGRKLPLLVGLGGNLFYSVMIVVNALNESWPVEWILWTACLPCSLTGGNLTVFMASFSYLADTTSQQERTIRTTMLEVAYLIPMPLGIFIGSYLFKNVVNQSYAAMFTINSIFLASAILYSLIALEWKTAPTTIRSQSNGFIKGIITPISETLKALFRRREDCRRMILLLVIFSMALYTFQRDEKSVFYLYAQRKFSWGVEPISYFRTLQAVLFVFGLLVGVPIMKRLLGLKDMIIILIGTISHSAARVIFILAQHPFLLYVGTIVGLLGPTVAPVLRSIVSKLVPPSERGKIYAMFSVSDNAVPLVSGIAYNKIYLATRDSFPQGFFLVTITSQMVVFFIAVFLLFKLKGRPITQAEDTLPVVSS